LNDYPATLAANSAAIKISEDLIARFPENAEYSRELALTLADRSTIEKVLGKMKEASATLDRALKLAEGPQGKLPDSSHRRALALIVSDQADLAYFLGRLDDAAQLSGRSAELLFRGELLLALEQPKPATAGLMKSLAMSRVLLDRHGVLTRSMLIRGNTFLALGRAQAAARNKNEALAFWKNAATVFEIALKIDPDNFYHKRGLADARRKLAELIQSQLSEARRTLSSDSPQLADALAPIGLSLLQQKKWTEAEPLLRECLAIREKTQPDVWSTFNTQSILDGALLGQQNYADAGPLLLTGYEGMKAREKSIPEQSKIRIPEALERLVQLYEATDKKDEAAKWSKELDVTFIWAWYSARAIGAVCFWEGPRYHG
jgi:tetratricopeptide (TPR) repeat protein